MKCRVFGGILVSLGFAFLFSCAPATSTPTSIPTQNNTSIRGVVLDEEKHPLANVTVRIKATEHFVTTASDGSFELTGLPAGQLVSVTAFIHGYYIGGGEEILPGTADAEIVLKRHANEDNEKYEWLSAFSDAGEDGNCENCHQGLETAEAFLPFAEWQDDAHALSTQNIHFLTMYLGQDVNGNQSPPREYSFSRDYGRIPMRPDPNQPYYGPGYKLDFPETAGNCSSCHAPAAAINAAYETDPTHVSGVGAEGAACDFCHKIWDVSLDPSTGLPQTNMPGVLSFEFRRPPKGHQFFAGPLDDVAPGEDTYVPIQTQSQFCAPCHFQSFWGTQVYNSFGEWLESPYSDVESGKTCQDCHMPVGKSDHFVRLDAGGTLRDPQTIFSHLMPGASDVELLQNAVSMTAGAQIENDRLVVEVNITNDQTGHHVPTDSPLRQMILLVDATDENGQALSLLEGETIPAWGGVGDPSLGYYAGLPGKGYAKILMEMWTEIEPTGSYWNPTQIVSDNRIAAFESDASTYIFAAPDNGEARLKITLLFRRAFKDLMDQKGWDVPDITMEEETLHVNSQ